MKRGQSSWLSVVVYSLVAAFLMTFGLVLQSSQGSNWAFLWAAGIALAVIQLISMADLLRIRRVRSMVPEAMVVSISAYEQLAAQQEALRGIEGVTTGRPPRRSAHCVVSITSHSLSVWNGAFTPKPILEIPRSRIGEPILRKTPQGLYQLSSIRVPIVDSPSGAVVDLCVIDWRFLFPAVASSKVRQEVADAIQRAGGHDRSR